MSNSVQPQRRQPTRLRRPWDSPGTNTGVGCHFLLQCRKVKSESEVAQSCLTLCVPMDCSPPGSPVHGIFQARGLEWAAIATPTEISVFVVFSVCVYICVSCSHKDTSHVVAGPTLRIAFQPDYICKDPISNKITVTSTGLRI